MQPLSDRLKPDCLSELDFDRLLADERKGTARLTAHVASCDRCRARLAALRAERDAWLARTDIRARVARLASAVEIEDEAPAASRWRWYWWVAPLVTATVAAGLFALWRSDRGGASAPPERVSAESLEVRRLIGERTVRLDGGDRVPVGARLVFHAACGSYCNLTLFVLRETGAATQLWPSAGDARLEPGPDPVALGVEHAFRPAPDHELFVGLFCRQDMGARYSMAYLEKRFPLVEGHRRLSDAVSVGDWSPPLCRMQVQRLSRPPGAGGAGSAVALARRSLRDRATSRVERVTAREPRVRAIRGSVRACERSELGAVSADAGRRAGGRRCPRARWFGARGASDLLALVVSAYRCTRVREWAERAVRIVVTAASGREHGSTTAAGRREPGSVDRERFRLEAAHERWQQSPRVRRLARADGERRLLARLAVEWPGDVREAPPSWHADDVFAAIVLLPRLVFAPDGAGALMDELGSREGARLAAALYGGDSSAAAQVCADRGLGTLSLVDRYHRRGARGRCKACIDVMGESEGLVTALRRVPEPHAWPRLRGRETVDESLEPSGCLLAALARRGRDLEARLAGALAASVSAAFGADGLDVAGGGSVADAASIE